MQLSDPENTPNGSFPDLAVDSAGNLHAVWYAAIRQTDQREDGALEILSYRWSAGGIWSAPRTIVALHMRPALAEENGQTGGVIDVTLPEYTLQNALAWGRDGKLHIGIGSETMLLYLNAPLSGSGGLAAPGVPQELGNGRFNALASADDGSLHLTYNERVETEPRPGITVCNACRDIMYRRSNDGGATWSSPINVSRVAGDDGQQQLKADGQGRLHLIWNHLQNDPAGAGGPPQVIYRRSLDGGQSWQESAVLGPADEGALQGALGLSLEGNPFVVYRSATGQQLFFQRSDDGGASWSLPGIIPGVRARNPADTATDSYSLATDSANRLHLLLVGFLSGDPGETPKLLHLTWDGQAWSEPRLLMDGPPFPEAPRLVVERGNRLHAIWFTREGLAGPAQSLQRIWYSGAQLDAPDLAPAPLFTPVPTPTASLPTVTPLVVPTPISSDSRAKPLVAGPPSWEGQGLATLSIALAPLILLVLFVGWRSLVRWHDEGE